MRLLLLNRNPAKYRGIGLSAGWIRLSLFPLCRNKSVKRGADPRDILWFSFKELKEYFQCFLICHLFPKHPSYIGMLYYAYRCGDSLLNEFRL